MRARWTSSSLRCTVGLIVAKKTSSSSDSKPLAEASDLSYEQAVEELELLIDRIESGEVGLERSLEEYERGVSLLKRCRAIISKAEQRLEELTPDPDGES